MSSYKVVTAQGKVEVVEANSPLAAVKKYASTVLGLSIKAIRLTTEEAMNSGWKFRAELLENGAKAKKSYYWTESREEYENERQAAGNRGGQGATVHVASTIGKSKRKATNEVYISAKKKRQQARKQLEKQGANKGEVTKDALSNKFQHNEIISYATVVRRFPLNNLFSDKLLEIPHVIKSDTFLVNKSDRQIILIPHDMNENKRVILEFGLFELDSISIQ